MRPYLDTKGCNAGRVSKLPQLSLGYSEKAISKGLDRRTQEHRSMIYGSTSIGSHAQPTLVSVPAKTRTDASSGVDSQAADIHPQTALSLVAEHNILGGLLPLSVQWLPPQQTIPLPCVARQSNDSRRGGTRNAQTGPCLSLSNRTVLLVGLAAY